MCLTCQPSHTVCCIGALKGHIVKQCVLVHVIPKKITPEECLSVCIPEVHIREAIIMTSGASRSLWRERDGDREGLGYFSVTQVFCLVQKSSLERTIDDFNMFFQGSDGSSG